MLVSSRDCWRTASSRRQLWTAFTRSSKSNGEFFSAEEWNGTRTN